MVRTEAWYGPGDRGWPPLDSQYDMDEHAPVIRNAIFRRTRTTRGVFWADHFLLLHRLSGVRVSYWVELTLAAVAALAKVGGN